MKGPGRRRKGGREYRISGFHGVKQALSRAGTGGLDGRSRAARAVARWRSGIESDLGNDLSTAERTLLEAAAGDVALMAVADTWIGANAQAIINRRKQAFVPLVLERLKVASHLADLLKILGTKRRPKPVASLQELLLAAGQDEAEAPPAGQGESDEAETTPQAVRGRRRAHTGAGEAREAVQVVLPSGTLPEAPNPWYGIWYTGHMKLLMASDVARALGVSVSLVRVLADSGKLPTVAKTVGGVRLFAPKTSRGSARKGQRKT